MANLGDEIHAALLAAVKTVDQFPVVTYPNGVRTTSATEFLSPATVLAKPLQSTWSIPERNRQREFRERATWLWEVTVEFSREVSLEEFEDANTNSLLRIPRTATKPQVDLIFEEANYVHPPEQQAGGGSRVRYRVRAELTPL